MRLTAIAIVVGGCLICPHIASAQGRLDVLYAFSDNPESRLALAPDAPITSIMEARDGSFLITSAGGGVYRRGAIFRANRDGTVILLHSFRGEPDGAMPLGALLEASDGVFYGPSFASHQAVRWRCFMYSRAVPLTGRIRSARSCRSVTGPLSG